MAEMRKATDPRDTVVAAARRMRRVTARVGRDGGMPQPLWERFVEAHYGLIRALDGLRKSLRVSGRQRKGGRP